MPHLGSSNHDTTGQRFMEPLPQHGHVADQAGHMAHATGAVPQRCNVFNDLDVPWCKDLRSVGVPGDNTPHLQEYLKGLVFEPVGLSTGGVRVKNLVAPTWPFIAGESSSTSRRHGTAWAVQGALRCRALDGWSSSRHGGAAVLGPPLVK